MLDNYDLFEERERMFEQRNAKLPVCDKCGKVIQDDYYFFIDHDTLCENCMQDLYMFNTEDYE